MYSSYLGGEIEDVGYGIAVDGSADAYVTGLTYSTKFPTSTTGALQTTYRGAGDAFVTKVNTTINTTATAATSLVYSTYLGGTGLDQGNAIALDSAGNIYIAGLTNSATFGFTPAATVVQPTYKGQGDAFVAELTNAGALSYFTYLGGTHADSATGIAVDSTGNVYITGTTASTDFPTAGAVFQPAYGGGNTDSFVAKIGPAGNAIGVFELLRRHERGAGHWNCGRYQRLRVRYRPDVFERFSARKSLPGRSRRKLRRVHSKSQHLGWDCPESCGPDLPGAEPEYDEPITNYNAHKR